MKASNISNGFENSSVSGEKEHFPLNACQRHSQPGPKRLEQKVIFTSGSNYRKSLVLRRGKANVKENKTEKNVETGNEFSDMLRYLSTLP